MITDSLDSVQVRLEPGWKILRYDKYVEGTAAIVNETDESRFEFAIFLSRLDLTSISPLDALRLQVLVHEEGPLLESPASCGGAHSIGPRRWSVECHARRRRDRVYLVPSPERPWLHTREIDSEITRRHLLVASRDGRRGLLLRYTDVAEITAGRDEAQRILDSIDFDEPAGAPAIDASTAGGLFREQQQLLGDLPRGDWALWCARKGDQWRAEGNTGDAIAAFMALIDSEQIAGEPPAGLGNSYLRLACALVDGGLFVDALAAFRTAISLLTKGSAPPEVVGSAHFQYGVALHEDGRYLDESVSELRNARELLEGHETSESIASVDCYIGLALKTKMAAMIGRNDRWRKIRATKKEAVAALRSAIARLERDAPASPRLEQARTALEGLRKQRWGVLSAIFRL